MTKLFFLIVCVSMVQWSRSCLHTCKPGSTPATLFSVSLYVFFFSVWPFFNTTFPFSPFFFILTAHLATHPLGSISGVLFWKRDFKSWKSSWSAYMYWPSLWPEKKKHKLSRHVPPLKQLNFFFNVSWHHDKQHTVHHNCTNLYPTPASDPLAKVKLAFCTSS